MVDDKMGKGGLSKYNKMFHEKKSSKYCKMHRDCRWHNNQTISLSKITELAEFQRIIRREELFPL